MWCIAATVTDDDNDDDGDGGGGGAIAAFISHVSASACGRKHTNAHTHAMVTTDSFSTQTTERIT